MGTRPVSAQSAGFDEQFWAMVEDSAITVHPIPNADTLVSLYQQIQSLASMHTAPRTVSTRRWPGSEPTALFMLDMVRLLQADLANLIGRGEQSPRLSLYRTLFPQQFAFYTLAPVMLADGTPLLDLELYRQAGAEGQSYRDLARLAFGDQLEGLVLKSEQYLQQRALLWQIVAAIGGGEKSVADYQDLLATGLQHYFDTAVILSTHGIAVHDQNIRSIWRMLTTHRQHRCEMGDRDLLHMIDIAPDLQPDGDLIKRRYLSRSVTDFFAPSIHHDYTDESFSPAHILTIPAYILRHVTSNPENRLSGGAVLLSSRQWVAYMDKRLQLLKQHQSAAAINVAQDSLVFALPIGAAYRGACAMTGRLLQARRTTTWGSWLLRYPQSHPMGLRLAYNFWLGVGMNAYGSFGVAELDRRLGYGMTLPDADGWLQSSLFSGVLGMVAFGGFYSMPYLLKNRPALAAALGGWRVAMSKSQGEDWNGALLKGAKFSTYAFVGPSLLQHSALSYGFGALEQWVDGQGSSMGGRPLQDAHDAGMHLLLFHLGFNALSCQAP